MKSYPTVSYTTKSMDFENSLYRDQYFGGSRGPPDRVRVTGLVFLDWANQGLSNGILHDQIAWISKNYRFSQYRDQYLGVQGSIGWKKGRGHGVFGIS